MSPSDAGPHRLLVTGGAGFIGGNFVHQVLADPDVAVLNLDLLTYAGHPATLRDLEGDVRHRFVRGDIGDRDLVARLLVEFRPDAIVNFAAESHVDRSIDGPAAFIQTNVTGTFNLLDCARGYWRELPDEERAEFERLVEDACFFDQPSRQRGARPDAFQYIIVIERGGERHEVLADERAMAGELRPLVERQTRLARR